MLKKMYIYIYTIYSLKTLRIYAHDIIITRIVYYYNTLDFTGVVF